MKGNTQMVKKTALEDFNGMMNFGTMGFGKMTKCMGLEAFIKRMSSITWVNFAIIGEMEMEKWLIVKKNRCMMENGKMINLMDMAFILKKMEIGMRGSL